MKIKDKIKTYGFWVSIASAIILILKILGNRFGFTVDETMVSDLFTALCSTLVILGIIVMPNSQPAKQNSNEVPTKKENEAAGDTSPQNNDNPVEPLPEQETQKQDEITNTETSDTQENQNILPEEENIITVENNQTNEIPSNEPIIETNNDNNETMVIENENTHNEEENAMQNNNESQIESQMDINTLYQTEREKFAGNLEEYIAHLENEINKFKGNM